MVDRKPKAQAPKPSLKSLLAKVPDRVRIGFLESMIFINGKLASARIYDVKQNLTSKEYKALKMSVGWGGLGEDASGYACKGPGACTLMKDYICAPLACKGPTPKFGGDLSVAWMVRNAPKPIRTKFLHSIDYRDGQLIGGDRKVIEPYANNQELANFPKVQRSMLPQ